jgi:L-amino acid N-acyltransferase YncA
MTPFHIRPATPADARATAELLNAIIAAGGLTSMADPLTVQDQVNYLCAFPDPELFLLAEDHATGRLAGMQSLEPYRPGEPALVHVGEISTFVAEAFRGQGIGSLLAEHLLPAAQRKGYRKVMALIRADNPGALAFYARQGFRTVGTLRGHTRHQARFLDQVLCERMIGE